ncbi:uncharacterized protein [Typha angustifolia]
MQADEDVGKIALAVPLLVSKALELFLQDLCDRTYEITLHRGAKTFNSSHLKQCVKMYSAFDFLTDVVNKVHNLGGREPCGDQKGLSRRRKSLSDDSDLENGESKSTKMSTRNSISSPRGRGRDRGRGRGRPPTRTKEIGYVKFEDEISSFPEHDEPLLGGNEGLEKNLCGDENISASMNPSCNSTSDSVAAASATEDAKQAEYSAWVLPDLAGNIVLESSKFVQLMVQIDEDEDYDNED